MQEENPLGTLTTRTLAMPADTNAAGDIFGGWVLSQMDIAAGICAEKRAQERIVTVALQDMSFIRPVKVGDVLGLYTQIAEVGRTSVLIHVEGWITRDRVDLSEKVAEGLFKFVAIDKDGLPTPLPSEADLPAHAKQ